MNDFTLKFNNNKEIRINKNSLSRDISIKNLAKSTILNIFDKDGDGVLNISNVTNENEVESIFEKILSFDENYDGTVTEEEIKKGIKKDKSLKGKDTTLFIKELSQIANEKIPNVGLSDEQLDFIERMNLSKDQVEYLENLYDKGDINAINDFIELNSAGKLKANSPVNASEVSNNSQTAKKIEQSQREITAGDFTDEEIQDVALNTLSEDLEKAFAFFQEQENQSGAISDGINGTKEFFGTDLAKSRVDRIIRSEHLKTSLINKASRGELTEREYLQAKLDFVKALLIDKPSSTFMDKVNKFLDGAYWGEHDKLKLVEQLLEDALKELTPETLDNMITHFTSGTSQEEFENLNIDDMLSFELEVHQRKNTKSPYYNDGHRIITITNPNSIGERLKTTDDSKLITFEQAFLWERGVKYNKENVFDYTQKNAKLTALVGVKNKVTSINNRIDELSHIMSTTNPENGLRQQSAQNLREYVFEVLDYISQKDPEKRDEIIAEICKHPAFMGMAPTDVIDVICGKKQTDELQVLLGASKDPQEMLLKIFSEGLKAHVNGIYENQLDGKKLDDYQKEANDAYIKAYGFDNAEALAEEYSTSLQNDLQYVKAGVQWGGMLLVIGSQVVPVAGQAVGAMALVGTGMGAFGGVAIDAIEKTTRNNPITDEEIKEIGKELAIAVGLFASGMKIGKMAEDVKMALLANNCPKLLARASEIGVDATLSLIADKAITGEIDLKGQGLSEVITILVGVIKAKRAKFHPNKEHSKVEDIADNAPISVSGSINKKKMSVEERVRSNSASESQSGTNYTDADILAIIAKIRNGENDIPNLPKEVIDKIKRNSKDASYDGITGEKLTDVVRNSLRENGINKSANGATNKTVAYRVRESESNITPEIVKENISNNSRLSETEKAELTKLVNEKNADFIHYVLGDVDFEFKNAQKFIAVVNKENIEFAKTVYTTSGGKMDPDVAISYLKYTNSENLPVAEFLYNNPELTKQWQNSNIRDCIMLANKDNLDITLALLQKYPDPKTWIGGDPPYMGVNQNNIGLVKFCMEKNFTSDTISALIAKTGDKNYTNYYISLYNKCTNEFGLTDLATFEVLKNINETNYNFAMHLLTLEGFPKYNVGTIIEGIKTQEQIHLAAEVLNDPNININNCLIGEVIAHTTNENLDIVKLLAARNFPNGKISTVLKGVNYKPERIPLTRELLLNENFKIDENFEGIVCNITKDNIEFAKNLGTRLADNEAIALILHKSANNPYFDKLAKMKDTPLYIFSKFDSSKIDGENFEFLRDIFSCKDTRFDINDPNFSFVVYNYKKSTADVINYLADKKVSYTTIGNMAYFCDNNPIVKELLNSPNVDVEKLSKFAGVVTKDNIDIARKLLNDKKASGLEILDIIREKTSQEVENLITYFKKQNVHEDNIYFCIANKDLIDNIQHPLHGDSPERYQHIQRYVREKLSKPLGNRRADSNSIKTTKDELHDLMLSYNMLDGRFGDNPLASGQYHNLFAVNEYVQKNFQIKDPQTGQMRAPKDIYELKKYGNLTEAQKADLENEVLVAGFRDYFKEHPKSVIGSKYYQDYYIGVLNKNLPADIKTKCLEFDRKFGTKIVFPANVDVKVARECMQYIEAEFNVWKQYGGNDVNYPPSIDFSTLKQMFYESSKFGGYAESDTKSLSFPGMNLDNLKFSLRHEMTHANDTKMAEKTNNSYSGIKGVGAYYRDSQGNILREEGTGEPQVDLKNCKFAEEMIKAGIPEVHVKYAYADEAELLAVAAEGDMSLYTPEFKAYLEARGMKKWQFKMPSKASLDSPDFIKRMTQFIRPSGIRTR